MKVKLLKKIRRRFSYYRNSKGIMVVVVHINKRAFTVDSELLKTKYPNYPDVDITEDSLFTLFKILITQPWYGDGYAQLVRYRYATRRSLRPKTK